MVNLYILCGLPYSGKSTFAKEMAVKTGYALVSYDDVWQTLRHLDEDISYELALKDCKDQIYDLLSNGYSVIYDSANLMEEHRQFIKSIADNLGLNTVIIYLKVPEGEILKRREASVTNKTHHAVSEENFGKALKQFEEPVDAVIIQNESDKDDFLRQF